MLGIADEDGHVKLLDTRKTKESSIIKGNFVVIMPFQIIFIYSR